MSISFSDPVTLEGAGFELLTPAGVVVAPRSRTSDGGTTWTLEVLQPVDGGVVALRFEAAGDDGHLFTDTLTFTTPGGDGQETPGLEDFLSEFGGADSSTRAAAAIGRFLQMASVLVSLGILVFAATCLTGPLASEPRLETALISAGMIMVVGAAAEAIGIAASFGLDAGEFLTTERLGAPRIRLVGGVLIAYAAMGSPGLRHLLFAAGTLLATAAFGFDGHTATEEPRALMVLADLLHVAAGGVWIGGVAALVMLWAARDRKGDRKAQLSQISKFGSVAAAALVPLLLGGTMMAAIILDQWGQLFSTPWGRTLLIKLLAVMAALALGARHHIAIAPRARQPESSVNELVKTLQVELAVLLAIVAGTVALLAASPR